MLAEVEAVHNRIYMDRLVNRRDRIMARIRTLDEQLRQLERDALLYDENGKRQRKDLLIYLANFHHTEVDQLGSALTRLATGTYGRCLACNGVVEADWLESFPEGEFCSSCSRIRQRMAEG